MRNWTKGFSLVEMTVTMGLMGAGALFMLNMQDNNMKTMAGIEAKVQRMEMKAMISQMILSNPDNCKCLFQGVAPFSAPAAPPGITLGGTMPTKLGRFQFPTPGSCAGAAMPSPYLEENKIHDGYLVKDIRIEDVTGFDQLYSGNLTVDLESVKKATASRSIGLKIPISITTVPVGPNQRLVSCGELSSGSDSVISLDSSDGVGATLSVETGTRSFTFAGVPATAKAVFINYVIGQASNGRNDRYCQISGTGVNVFLGTESKGDGGQHMVGGTAFVPYKPGLTMTCDNTEGGGGRITVSGVMK